MEKISLEQFIAEIETTFSNYAESNDIDHQSIKTWVIQELRKFGKNICDTSETVVEVKNKRALLPETFKSLILAAKIDNITKEEKEKKRWVNEKQYISNPAIWDSYTQDYIINYCETRIVTEKTYLNVSEDNCVSDVQILELEDYINKDAVDINCLNLHPSIRNVDNNRISINNRTLNTNFKEGTIYMKYNSLPNIDGEIAIPIITTGDIYKFIENEIKYKVAENLIINNKNPTGLAQLFQTYAQNSRGLFVLAQGEAKWKGLGNNWQKTIYKKNLTNRRRIGL
jgi:hypothetical protein